MCWLGVVVCGRVDVGVGVRVVGKKLGRVTVSNTTIEIDLLEELIENIRLLR